MPKTSERREPRDPADSVAHALRHRLRVDILTVLHEGPASQKELSTQLREPLSNITHHINELSEAGAIEVAYSKMVGNVEQNYWRAIDTSSYLPGDLAGLTVEEHQGLSRIIVQSIMAEVLAALRAGHLAGDPYAATAWDRVWLDERGYRELNEATDGFFERMYEVAAESAERASGDDDSRRLYVGAVMAFERSRSESNTTAALSHLAGAPLREAGAPDAAAQPAARDLSKGEGAGKARDVAEAVASAVAHRLRVDILTVLHDGPASQKELSAELREPLGKITHHVNELSEAGAIEVAFTKMVGNVEQNYWRAIKTSSYWPEDLAKLTVAEHQELSRTIVQSMMAELLASLRAGRLAGDPYSATAWDRVWLDERGYQDLNKATDVFFERMHEIAAESAGRSEESGEERKPYIGAVMAFRRSRTEPNTTVTVGHLGQGEPSGKESPFEK